MAKSLSNVPLKNVVPGPEYVLVQQFDSHMSAGGLHLPDRAKVVVHIAKAVGSKVKHVQVGDIVITAQDRALVAIPEVGGNVALVPGDVIAAVIRGYNWRDALNDEATKPALVA